MMFIMMWCIFFFTCIVRSWYWWMHICWLIEMLLVNTYMLIELWMLLVIAYMSSDGKLLVNAYMLNDRWWCVNCLYEHMHWVESYVHAYMTDGDGCLYPKCKTGVKSYIRCFCCIEGDDLEVIWYRMHLEESRTLHAFE